MSFFFSSFFLSEMDKLVLIMLNHPQEVRLAVHLSFLNNLTRTACNKQLLLVIPPHPQYLGGGGVILITLSICSSVHVSDCVCSLFPEPLNRVLPNLIWWCIIMRWCVMQKNWFTIFNVKVTARAYIIKIWLFLLYLLTCNQTWFDSKHHKPECPV